MTNRARPIFVAICIVLGIGAAAVAIWPDRFAGSERSVVVYCAHDAVFAKGILDEFQKRTGIAVNVRYDTEATKSLSFVNQLKLEKDDPHCDVFWNNELLGSMDLAHDELLEPYKGPGFERIPAAYKDPEGRWTGFAARMRVWIVNTKLGEPTPSTIRQRFEKDPARAVIARPLYGTTLTQYSILWQLWGPERLKHWDADMRRRGLRQLAGNAPVKDAVAEGVCDIGWTDTDDYFEAFDDKKPVTMLPILVDEPSPAAPTPAKGPPKKTEKDKALSTNAVAAASKPPRQFAIVVPNTVCLIRGSKHPKEARQLIDYLLSAETELALAKSKSRQIPLGPVEADKLPFDVGELSEYVSQGYDLRTLEKARRDCLAWLKSESPQ